MLLAASHFVTWVNTSLPSQNTARRVFGTVPVSTSHTTTQGQGISLTRAWPPARTSASQSTTPSSSPTVLILTVGQSSEFKFRLVVFFCLQKLHHLGRLLTDLAEIWYTFDLTLDQKSHKIFCQICPQRPRKGVSGATFEGKKHQPKFNGRTLVIELWRFRFLTYRPPGLQWQCWDLEEVSL